MPADARGLPALSPIGSMGLYVTVGMPPPPRAETIDLHHPNMKTFLNQLQQRLEQSLAVAQSEQDEFKQLEQSIIVVKAALQELRIFLYNYQFRDETEQIWFFKEAKPELFSLLIYYETKLLIGMKRPWGNRKKLRGFLENELNYMEHFYDYNAEFHLYHVTGQTRFDAQYYTLKTEGIVLDTDTLLLDTDLKLSTGYDLKVARILAYDRLRKEICTELHTLKRTPSWLLEFTKIVPLRWTGPKNGLVELIYSFAASEVFNNGEVDIKQITVYFEQVFNVRLGNFYKTFEKNRIREGGMTRFLDHLKTELIKYIDKLNIFKGNQDE
jgi:hypothetical protein